MKKTTLILLLIAIIVVVILYVFFAVRAEQSRNIIFSNLTSEEILQLYASNNPFVSNRLEEGDKNAQVTITAVLDLESEESKLFYNETITQLREEYIKSGQIRLKYKYYVIKQDRTEINDRYTKTKAIYCYTNSGGKNITEIHEKIMNSKNINTIEINELQMDYNKYMDCMDNQEPRQLKEDVTESEQYKIQAPSIIIGINNQDNTVIYGQTSPEIIRRTIRNQQIKLGI